jgi:hypothetical protein
VISPLPGVGTIMTKGSDLLVAAFENEVDRIFGVPALYPIRPAATEEISVREQ